MSEPMVKAGCLGCEIAGGERVPPGGMIFETEHFLLHQDPDVPLPGFLIIATKRHVQSILQLSRAEAVELAGLVYDARAALWQEDILDVTLVQEERSGHFHLWLFPRYAWMNKLFPASLSSIRAVMAYVKEHRNSPAHLQLMLAEVAAIKQRFM